MSTSIASTPSQAGSHPASGYRLLHPQPSSALQVRANLVDILHRELLGPAGGVHELLEASPEVVYLLGRIAPAQLTGDPSQRPYSAEAEYADEPDLGDELDAIGGRGLPLNSRDDGGIEAEEDRGDDQSAQRGLMIPASMGLRFQVPREASSFTVHSTWATYHPVTEASTPLSPAADLGSAADPTNPANSAKSAKSGDAGAPGQPQRRSPRRYQRTPVAHTRVIRLADLTPGQTTSVPLQGTVVLRVDAYLDAPNDRWIIEVALCNDAQVPRRVPIGAWLFQTQLRVEAEGQALFLPVRDVELDSAYDHDSDEDRELRRLDLIYRDTLEFAIGRTCSADWQQAEDSRRATAVWTTWMPHAQTPQVRAQHMPGVVLDMTALAQAGPEQLEAGLRPLVSGYQQWLLGQDASAQDLPKHLRPEAHNALAEARAVAMQLAAGLDFLISDAQARECFGFMNQVMADQRIQSQVAALRVEDQELTRAQARDRVLAQGPQAHSWRAFQLAFILMQLSALSRPGADHRSGRSAHVELLFFPTGGGKTEAYLGLAAFTFAIRRRQGLVASTDGPLDGGRGVAVLMRYTLRLLTSQQFQRASTLICAAELARRADPKTWGNEPFRIGLWVGTDVSPKRFDQAQEQIREAHEGSKRRLTVLQLDTCPWCGTRIEARDVVPDATTRRVYTYCGDPLGQCPFAQGGSGNAAGSAGAVGAGVPRAGEGLPVLTVDEEIYRLAPDFVIATVDKFARLAREGEAAALFGYVSQRCARHGYVHPDSRACGPKVVAKHPASKGYPPATVSPTRRLRPPDLIIQDELHLITGALGTSVALFEVAIDVMCGWSQVPDDGSAPVRVRPLVVASSATVRNAVEQVHALYGRQVTLFPPQVLDIKDSYFAAQVPISAQDPGRLYLGVNTTGVRLTRAEIRVSELLLLAGQLQLDVAGDLADPYLTLVDYFSSMRELAGMARYLGDDVQTAVRRGLPWTALPPRLSSGADLSTLELNARVNSRDLGAKLAQMGVAFDPDRYSTAARRAYVAALKRGEPPPQTPSGPRPFDVVLATSMLQVGVDVSRLGLMMVVGQPKNTAEYIQASSRVGRDPHRPGLVISLGNWSRPRDQAHFEQFRHYHEMFYARVEPLTVTPFSLTSLDRSLDGVLVSAARVLQGCLPDGLSPEANAGRVVAQTTWLHDLVEVLLERVKLATTDEDRVTYARERLGNRIDTWLKRRSDGVGIRKTLVYERVRDAATQYPLIEASENDRRVITRAATPFRIANSMREVQPEINLLVPPAPDQLFWTEPPGTPRWLSRGEQT